MNINLLNSVKDLVEYIQRYSNLTKASKIVIHFEIIVVKSSELERILRLDNKTVTVSYGQ